MVFLNFSIYQRLSAFSAHLVLLFVITSPILSINSQSVADCEDVLDRGNCSYSLERYAFDPHSHTCVSFTYSGCGGNANNFLTLGQCVEACRQFISPPKTEEDDVTQKQTSGILVTSSTEPAAGEY